MAILGGKSKQTENDNSAEKKTVQDIAVLFQQNKEILEGIDALQNSVNAIDKNNKKFLMTASMQKTEMLENQLLKMKMGIIELLDQIDIIVSAVYSSSEEGIKKGLPAFTNKVSELAGNMNIEEIPVVIGEEFNPKVQECKEVVSLSEYEDDTVTSLIQRGYVDGSNGKMLRCASVIVNKK